MGTTAQHSYPELTYVGTSGHDGEIVTFGAPSSHDPHRVNLVQLDTATGAILCDCRHAETRPSGSAPTCWHAREVRKAEYARKMRPRVAGWPDNGLADRERALLAKVAAGAASDADRVMLDLLGDEVARRTAPAVAA